MYVGSCLLGPAASSSVSQPVRCMTLVNQLKQVSHWTQKAMSYESIDSNGLNMPNLKQQNEPPISFCAAVKVQNSLTAASIKTEYLSLLLLEVMMKN